MGLPQDFMNTSFESEAASPLSKRRRFTPQGLPAVIPSSDNSGLEDHTFSSPLLLQLCEQAPTPEDIEASLLQVGMRIRKSVSEGYKNSPQKKFTPRPFFNVRRLSPETQKALISSNTESSGELSSYHAGGLHNVGGMAMQPISTATFCGVNLAALAHYSSDWSSPSVSQQSLWSYSTSSKRGYEADSDSDDSQDWVPQTPNLTADAGMYMPVDYFNIDVETMSDVSPMTQIGDRARREANGRKIAKPRSKVRQTYMNDVQTPPTSAFNPFANLTMPQEQPQYGSFAPTAHKRILSCSMEANMMNDFGEAPFLQRREDVEMDCS